MPMMSVYMYSYACKTNTSLSHQFYPFFRIGVSSYRRCPFSLLMLFTIAAQSGKVRYVSKRPFKSLYHHFFSYVVFFLAMEQHMMTQQRNNRKQHEFNHNGCTDVSLLRTQLAGHWGHRGSQAFLLEEALWLNCFERTSFAPQSGTLVTLMSSD